MSEIDLKYSDLSLVGTFTFQRFRGLDIEEERAKKAYERAKEKNRVLTYYLQKKGIISDEEYRCFISWCNHSNYSINEIANQVFEKEEINFPKA